jgi:hypothetical protein
MAKAIRARNRTFSQDRVAEEISFTWQHKDPRAPGHVTLKSLISKMEKTGELPKRQSVSEAPSTD